MSTSNPPPLITASLSHRSSGGYRLKGQTSLITHLTAAEQHLADIVAGLTGTPAAIVLDLGLGLDSGFTVLRTCHAQPKLQQVPILVWTKHIDQLAKTFSNYLGVKIFLVKSSDERELREALKRLLWEHPA